MVSVGHTEETITRFETWTVSTTGTNSDSCSSFS